MTGTWLESPILWRDEGTNVEIDEEILVFPGTDVRQGLFDHSDALLKSIEVARSNRLGVAEDVCCSLDKAGLQSLLGAR